ncbi:hypothetical protein GCM10010220_16000 [Streptomyces parvulus]|nr:hypothetical protein GCM10010220_16000 [Streptomyces parvulus]
MPAWRNGTTSHDSPRAASTRRGSDGPRWWGGAVVALSHRPAAERRHLRDAVPDGAASAADLGGVDGDRGGLVLRSQSQPFDVTLAIDLRLPDLADVPADDLIERWEVDPALDSDDI